MLFKAMLFRIVAGVKYVFFGLLLLAMATFLAASYFVKFSSTARKAAANVTNSQKLTIGMTQRQVLRIMGKPAAVYPSYFRKNELVYFYRPPVLASNGIDITIGVDSTVTHIGQYR